MGNDSFRKNLAALALILAFVLAAYSNSFQAGFHYDDDHQIIKNQHIRTLSNIPRFFTDASLGSYQTDLKGYRPVTYSSFAASYAVSGYNVGGYHVMNLALHFLNAFLLFLVVGAVLKAAGHERRFWAALAAALIFALHPVQTNAVTYISGRAALLTSLFCLLALLCFIKFRAGGKARFLCGALSPVFFLLAVMSKEMAVSFLGITLLYDLIFTAPRLDLSGKAKAALYYIPFLAGLAVFLAAKKMFQGYTTTDDTAAYTIGEYLMSEAKGLLVYLKVLVFPVNLNADYNLPVISHLKPSVVVVAVMVALVLFGLYRLAKGDKAAAFFGFWFFVALAPESTLFPIPDIVVEYRLYLPSAGLISAAVILASRLLARPVFRRAAVALTVSMFALLTFSRNAVWADDCTLWKDVVQKSPGSLRAMANYGNALVGMKRYGEAVAVLRRAIGMDPFYSEIYVVHNNLGISLMELGRYDEALGEFNSVLGINANIPETYGNLGAIYQKLGRHREAVDALEKGIGLSPGFGRMYIMAADSYLQMGMKKEALRTLEDALTYSDAKEQGDIRDMMDRVNR